MIKLPHGYISWTQLYLWEHNKELYRDVYFTGKKQQGNERMAFGKKFARLREGVETTDNEILELARITMPSLKNKEKSIWAWLPVGKGRIKIKGTPDGIDIRKLMLIEDKTGKKWTQRMVDENGQLTFYCLIVWLKHKKLLKSIMLNWLETRECEDSYEVEATGKCKTFSTQRKLSDLLLMVNRIIKTAKEISQEYKKTCP